jgi:chromosomal replication initiator protein
MSIPGISADGGKLLDSMLQLSRSHLAQAPKEPSISTLLHLSAARFGVRISAILSSRRDARSVTARHVAMYLARELTRRSFPELGSRFGNRHHTSVMHAVRSIEVRIKVNTSLCEDVAAIRRAVAAIRPAVTS